jgi:hypothetical protein
VARRGRPRVCSAGTLEYVMCGVGRLGPGKGPAKHSKQNSESIIRNDFKAFFLNTNALYHCSYGLVLLSHHIWFTLLELGLDGNLGLTWAVQRVHVQRYSEP